MIPLVLHGRELKNLETVVVQSRGDVPMLCHAVPLSSYPFGYSKRKVCGYVGQLPPAPAPQHQAHAIRVSGMYLKDRGSRYLSAPIATAANCPPTVV